MKAQDCAIGAFICLNGRNVFKKTRIWVGVSFSGAEWYFWLTIQNTANRHVSNAFDLLAVFVANC
jgi:hypothetical protein